MKHISLPRMLALLALVFAMHPAHAASRAWLDHAQVALGESVVLTLETDQATAVPDLSPLATDFSVSGQSDSRQVEMVNGMMTVKTRYAVNLTPRRDGVIAIPPLLLGNQRTAPLVLTVSAAAASERPASNAMAFLETEIDEPDPYVQQSVGVTLRLYYAVPLASGQLDLDTPQGASLQRIGDDVQSAREINGRRYNVVERRFLMVPDRSGVLTLPGARFVGRGVGGWMDDLLGGNSREMRATGAPRVVNVRAQPVNAPQPWLPLRDLHLRYVAAPQNARAGEAAAFVVEAIAQGATQSQMPELPTPSISGAQVFAEPPQYLETFNGGSPQVKLTRRYSVVPNGAGTLTVPGMKVAWWDVRSGTAKNASLPDITLQVARGTGGFAANVLPAPAGATDNHINAPGEIAGASTRTNAWIWAALGFAILWLATLAWALKKHRVLPDNSHTLQTSDKTPLPSHTLADLKRALDSGSLDDVGDALRGMCMPRSPDLDALLSQLQSPVQREAVELLRRARWADGDGVAARAALRDAFRNGPLWKIARLPAREVLPPLYPAR